MGRPNGMDDAERPPLTLETPDPRRSPPGPRLPATGTGPAERDPTATGSAEPGSPTGGSATPGRLASGSDAPGPLAPGSIADGGEPSTARPRSRRRTMLLIGLAAVLLLCLGGSITGYVLYDRATKLDRSTPFAALIQYVDYDFNQDDPDRARLYRCAQPDLGPLTDLFTDLRKREQQFNVTIQVSLANTSTQLSGRTATMRADLVLQLPLRAVSPQEVQPWEFTFRDESGWRLCGAKRRQS